MWLDAETKAVEQELQNEKKARKNLKKEHAKEKEVEEGFLIWEPWLLHNSINSSASHLGPILLLAKTEAPCCYSIAVQDSVWLIK